MKGQAEKESRGNAGKEKGDSKEGESFGRVEWSHETEVEKFEHSINAPTNNASGFGLW